MAMPCAHGQPTGLKSRAALNRAVEDPNVQQYMKAIALTPAWVDPNAYDATLRNVTDQAQPLRQLAEALPPCRDTDRDGSC